MRVRRIEAVARANGVNRQTLYAWRRRYAGMGASELAEFKALQEENRNLRFRPVLLAQHLSMRFLSTAERTLLKNAALNRILKLDVR